MIAASERVAVLVPVYNPRLDTITNLLDDLSSQGDIPLHLYLAIERAEIDFDLAEVVESFTATKPHICASFFLYDDQKGIGHALSHTMCLIKERLVVRHDIGDRMLPGRVSSALEGFLRHPEVAIFYSDAIFRSVDGSRQSSCPVHTTELKLRFAFQNPIIHPTVSFNLDELKRLSLNYDSKLRFCEDLDLWLRALKAGARFMFLEGAYLVYDKPSTVRSTKNWRANLFVRLRSFPSPNIGVSFLGVIMVAFFLLMPKSVKELIYRAR